MISIFSKKVFFADLLDGFTDIHCHILPGIDDGAKNIDVSLAMLNLYKELGFISIIGTPHMMEDYYNLDSEKIKNALNLLQNNDSYSSVGLKVKSAAEHLMDQQFSRMSHEKTLLPLAGNKVLIETGFISEPMQFKEMLFEMMNEGYNPILAHPERYLYIKSLKKYVSIKERGCSFQLNILSLSGNYGSNVQKNAEQLLLNGMIDYVATDAHHERHLKQLKELKINKKFIPSLEKAIDNTKRDFGF